MESKIKLAIVIDMKMKEVTTTEGHHKNDEVFFKKLHYDQETHVHSCKESQKSSHHEHQGTAADCETRIHQAFTAIAFFRYEAGSTEEPYHQSCSHMQDPGDQTDCNRQRNQDYH